MFIIILIPKGNARSAKSTDQKKAKSSHGPTILLSYSKKEAKPVPIQDFLYFVPMISIVSVENIISPNNQQFVKVISHRRQQEKNHFYVFCEFQIVGTGYCTNKFEPQEVILERIKPEKPGIELTNLLDYIKVKGSGFGNFEIKGIISGNKEIVTEVEVNFNGRGCTSPVTVGLYNVKLKNGKYLYKNRQHIVVARINTLSFVRSKATPKMGITLDTVGNNQVSDSILGKLKGFIANLIIEPIEIDRDGNKSLLAFADALTRKKQIFIFDKAKNLKSVRSGI